MPINKFSLNMLNDSNVPQVVSIEQVLKAAPFLSTILLPGLVLAIRKVK